MNKPVLSILFSLLFGTAVSQSSDSSPSFNKIDSIIISGMEQHQLPGIALGIVINGEIIYKKGYGYADKERKSAITSSTCFQLGSLTKMFTGYVLSQLIIENKINSFASIQLLYPSYHPFPLDAQSRYPLVIDVATHTASFPAYPANLSRKDGEPITGFSKQQLYESIDQLRLTGDVGEKWQYSNLGYGLLGTGLENLTGLSLDKLMRNYIFGPLAMTNTALYMNDSIQEQIATPYRDDNPSVTTKPWNMGSLAGAGNAFSNIEDLLKFLVFQMNEKNETLKLQHHSFFSMSANLGYGLGCFTGFSQSKNTRVIYHGGDIDGYASDFTFLPDKKFGVVILTNCGKGPEFSAISNAVFNTTYKLFYPPSERPVYPAERNSPGMDKSRMQR